MVIGDRLINMAVTYSEHSCATGALLLFAYINNCNSVHFMFSVFLALNRNVSLNYTLPFQLHQGQYQVFVYDIESDGTLASGVSYPAVNRDIIIDEAAQGMQTKR